MFVDKFCSQMDGQTDALGKSNKKALGQWKALPAHKFSHVTFRLIYCYAQISQYSKTERP